MPAKRVRVTARDRRGKPLKLSELRSTYEHATQLRKARPVLALDTPHGESATLAEGAAIATIPQKRSSAAFATLLHGLLEISRAHRNVELRVESPADVGSPFEHGVTIYRGAFDREEANGFLDALDQGRTPLAHPHSAPAAGAETIGELGELIALFEGIPFALSMSGAVYLPDGRETARQITPPGRFSPVAFSPDGRALAILGTAEGGEPTLWISRGGSGAMAPVALEEAGAPTGAAFSPDGTELAISTATGRIAVLPVDGHAATSIVVAAKKRLLDPAWSADSEWLACIAEDAARARTLHVISIGENEKAERNQHGGRLLSVESPADDDDAALADPVFAPDGSAVFVRALAAAAKGEPRVPRILRVAIGGGAAVAIGPPLARVSLTGGRGRFSDGRLFAGGAGDPGTKSVAAIWIDPATGDAICPHVPKGARHVFAAPGHRAVYARRYKDASRIWRTQGPDQPIKLVRLPVRGIVPMLA